MYKDVQTKLDTGRGPGTDVPKSKKDDDKDKDKDKDNDKKDKDGKDEAPKEDTIECDPEDDVWALDKGKPSEGRKYAKSCVNASRPLMLIMSVLGLFPLVMHRAKNGTYSCKFTWLSYAAILFIIAAFFIVVGTFWLLISLICISVNVPEHERYGGRSASQQRSEEVYVYKRNTVALVVTISSCIHATICMISVYHRREYIEKQLIYWTEVVELLHVDVGTDVAKAIWRHLAAILIFSVAMVVLLILNMVPSVSGAGSMLFVIMIRIFNRYCLWDPNLYIYKLFFAAYLLFIIISGYLFMLWFFYNCRILANILKIWNNRFEFCLHKHLLEMASAQANKQTRKEASESNRTSRGNLFQDHLVIFNLLEGVNATFETIMESYYLTTMIMIIFEAYAFVHSFNYYEYKYCGKRKLDIIPIALLLAIQLYIYISITIEAAAVAEESRHVLDIVRRKGMMTSKADGELWFMLSMRLSFGGHEDVGIVGAGFFHVTKAFLLGAISAIAAHFIIFYQFQVPISQSVEADATLDKLNISNILIQTEFTPSYKDFSFNDTERLKHYGYDVYC
ncbi:hypothetical protein Ocin01_13569 [Orchesella cincta]|uniref:Gustatory receptor n=1 Tax=Orchesella cincta TaxID=48709 RepID=A0A1D2MJC1_ORCCI|nr:hypothetical protein Ocin01_13569 [Orchesella cincta]